MSESAGAIVIGAGVNGLVAAACLAKDGRDVMLLKAQRTSEGSREFSPRDDGIVARHFAPLPRFDARVARALNLGWYGLKFVRHHLPLVGLRDDGQHVVLAGTDRATAQNLALRSQADADNWYRFGRELSGLGRALRYEDGFDACRASRKREEIARLSRQGAGAFLDFRFESEALKATLASHAASASPIDAGSALVLVANAVQGEWNASRQILRPLGGADMLARALEYAAFRAGVRIREGGQITDIVVERGRVRGVRVASGDVFAAPLVLSSLPRRETLLDLAHGEGMKLAQWDALKHAAPRTGFAVLVVALSALPAIRGMAVPAAARFVLADRVETYVAAHADSREGHLPDELPLAFVLVSDPSPASAKSVVMRIEVGPVPRDPVGGWSRVKTALATQVASSIERVMPGFSNAIMAVQMVPPDVGWPGFADADDGFPAGLRVHAGRASFVTPIDGLLLCDQDTGTPGEAAGRAGWMAARFALQAEVPS
jgi:phytoene dehydrogenase-like protein